jgi:hypothetical protein
VFEEKSFWLVGVWDYELIGIQLGRHEMEPTVLPRPNLSTVKILFRNNSTFSLCQVRKCIG